MASFARAFGALMHRCSISSLKDPSLTLIRRKPPKYLSQHLSLNTDISLVPLGIDFLGADFKCLRLATHDVPSVRRFRAFQPLCMGRRSCKIAGRKVRFHFFSSFITQDMVWSALVIASIPCYIVNFSHRMLKIWRRWKGIAKLGKKLLPRKFIFYIMW